MLFNSYEFILVFLPICLLGCFLLGNRGKIAAASWWLTGTSLGFYAWWNPGAAEGKPWSPFYLLLIITSIVFNYWLGVGIAREKEARPRRAKGFLTLGVTVNMVALAWFKYADFGVALANSAFGTLFPAPHVLLPLAISFFTFTQIAYLVDAWHGVTKEYNFRWYALFVSFFPHLIAGPIVLYRSLMPQFAKRETWRFNADNFAAGFTLFAFGLFKKAVIADALSPTANAVFLGVAGGGEPSLIVAWVGALAYTFQLYFDFSGYSDMAVGIGMMFNVRFPLNFDSPYKARDIVDFWRRWHITLSQFLRDHLYIPLGGSRCSPVRRYVNLFLTMLLGGLWHGAGWAFIIWGALHGAYLCVNHAWTAFAKNRAALQSKPAVFGGWLVTFLAVVVGWVFFKSGDRLLYQAGAVRGQFAVAREMLEGMCGSNGVSLPLQIKAALGGLAGKLHVGFAAAPFKVQELPWIFGAALIAFFAPNTQQLFRIALTARETSEPPIWKTDGRWAVLTAVVVVIAFFRLTGVTEFLYFQF